MLARAFTIGAVVAASMFLAVPSNAAATIAVNTTTDELNTDGDCSLREAVRAANSNTAIDACTAGTGIDVITVPAGTYTFALGGADEAAMTGDLDLTESVTISGDGARTTIVNANDLDRVFDVKPGTTVELAAMTIRNGTSSGNGGGIRSSGILRLVRTTVSEHTAGADGGGIYTEIDSLSVIRSTLSGNVSAAGGGAIVAYGSPVSLENSTVSGNQAECMGGGIAVFNGTTANLNNATIANNVADASPATPCPDANVGGISVSGAGTTATLSNTIVGDNRDASTAGNPVHPDCSGTITSRGYNLIENTNGCTITGPGTGDITGQDPRLDPLADNGGPTDTHQPKRNSPVVDAGNPSTPDGTAPECETDDQRGTNRPRGPRCDIGALERGAGTVLRCFGKRATLVGTEGSETLTGTGQRDVIIALGGDDTISTAGGRDLICAGRGNDRIRSGPGPDQVLGEAGNERIRAGGGEDLAIGGGGRDRMRGQGRGDTLRAGGGRDRLNGGGGPDRCVGGPGQDRVRRCES